jgi:hypothetical protein
MKLTASWTFRAIFLLPLINGALLSAPLERSVSTSRQFIIYGANAPLRGAVSDLAEQTKTNLLGVLQQRDHWKTPVIINLQFPQANLPEIPPAALYFSQTGFGLKLQLDLTIAADVDPLAIRRQLLRAVLLELIYRTQPDIAPGTAYVQPPDWLLEGLLAMAPAQERASLVEAAAASGGSTKIMPLEKFLRQKPGQLDSPGQLLYRAYSLALLQLLVDDTNGRSRLGRYIDNLSHASNDPLADLKAHFPVLAGADDIDRVWKSTVAKLGSAHSHQLLTFAETQRKLNELLLLKDPDAAGSPEASQLEDFTQVKASPAQKVVLKRLSQELLLLAASANPTLRPIVTEYQKIAQLLAAGKRNGLATRIAHLKIARAKLTARMNKIDDYMNWFEATQSKTRSGAFADYLRAASETAEAQPRRHDPLSVYLDALEGQFQE